MSWLELIMKAWDLFRAFMAKLGQEEQDAYEKHLQDIADADAARPVGEVSTDPYNRDNR